MAEDFCSLQEQAAHVFSAYAAVAGYSPVIVGSGSNAIQMLGAFIAGDLDLYASNAVLLGKCLLGTGFNREERKGRLRGGQHHPDYLAMGWQIIDATFVLASKQRNSAAETGAIKDGRIPKAFKSVDLAMPMFGYKNHFGIDWAHDLIRTWDASAANAHDGTQLPDVVSKCNTGLGV